MTDKAVGFASSDGNAIEKSANDCGRNLNWEASWRKEFVEHRQKDGIGRQRSVA